MKIEDKLKAVIRDVLDFPKPGIVFKDITPILKDSVLCREVVETFVERLSPFEIEAVAGIESRGFLFGMMLANKLDIPFIPIRKQGKLPYKTVSHSYDLEYGSATIEVHEDALAPGTKVLVHDDLLATGGTVVATSNLIKSLGGEVVGYSFLISLDFLNGRSRLKSFSEEVVSLVSY
ncbi:adenine phosphoribosyltransferase [Olivibacter sitiensis]|uniref:adenine phosphoribosyltransferase n=1 Tax=Olivibacter sitiensis TaxID=376470 RepID=UPI00041B433F|nr:adenine phosphoribosyltransferase [Olivibacter sitiensis]